MKTTKAQFDLFRKTFLNLVKKHGVYEWHFRFMHRNPCPLKEPTLVGSYAYIFADVEAMSADVVFVLDNERDFCTNEDIIDDAKHEFSEVLTFPLYIVGETRDSTASQREVERHRLVQRLTKIV